MDDIAGENVYQKKQFTSILPIKKYWLRKAQTSPTSKQNKKYYR
jgi:hypothetical protein